MASYFSLAAVANRERLAWPMLYAFVCGTLCAVALVGVTRPEFVADFEPIMLPLAATAAGSFCTVELLRYQQGIASPTEILTAAALVCGVGISLLSGLLLKSGYSRLALQTAAVVVPIVIVLATLGARRLPEPITAPIVAYAPTNGLPVPEWGR